MFLTIQFSMSTQFCSIRLIDRALLGATTSDQSGPGNDGSKEVLRIPQHSSINGTSSSDHLVSYQETRWGDLTPFFEMQLVYSTAPIDWAN